MQPKIGITLGCGVSAREFAKTYSSAVEEAGGSVVLLGSGDRAVARECDGLLFTGGRDIHPAHYPRRPEDFDLSDDEVINNYKLEIDTVRDGFEIPMARYALKSDIPILGICRGFQLLNVIAGGGMFPDIRKCIKPSQMHRFPKTKRALHEVTIEKGSRIGGLAGSGLVTVNSYHHQGVTAAEVAPGLVAAARCDDGIIEALEMPVDRFFVLVQWHPERKKDPEVNQRFKPLFEAFVAASRSGRS